MVEWVSTVFQLIKDSVYESFDYHVSWLKWKYSCWNQYFRLYIRKRILTIHRHFHTTHYYIPFWKVFPKQAELRELWQETVSNGLSLQGIESWRSLSAEVALSTIKLSGLEISFVP